MTRVWIDGIEVPVVGEPVVLSYQGFAADLARNLFGDVVGLRYRNAAERHVPFRPWGQATARGWISRYDQARMDRLMWKAERKWARRARQDAQRVARRATRKARR